MPFWASRDCFLDHGRRIGYSCFVLQGIQYLRVSWAFLFLFFGLYGVYLIGHQIQPGKAGKAVWIY